MRERSSGRERSDRPGATDRERDIAPPFGTATYVEAARTYTSAFLFLLLLGAGFVFDLILGGGIAHILGWLLAAALVVGVDVLIIYAARSTRSLSLTEDELRVGDEAIGRLEIVGVRRGVDDELPVLGWSTGMPRGVKGVTVRLFDDQDLVIPTRHPDRLEAALGVGAPAARAGAEVRPAEHGDLDLLANIDSRAGTVFRVAGYDLPDVDYPDGLTEAKAIFVLGTPPVGFACVDELDGLAHLVEIAVVPSSMKQGIGTRLLERACDWAREQGYPAITLSTYADVPWNGPYYAARGFVEASDVTPALAQLRAHEREIGLDAVARRIVMRRELAG